MTLLSRLAALLITALVLPVLAAPSAVVTTDQVRAELVVQAPQGVAPGRPLTLGLLMRHQPHWHSYWQNPGDSGLATTLTWQLPAGVSAGDIVWPAPSRLPFGTLVNYGYEGEVLLPVAAQVTPAFTGRTLDVQLDASWLVCADVCIPQSGHFTLQVPAGTPTTAQAAAFAAAQAAAPQPLPRAAASTRIEGKALAWRFQGLPAAWHGQPVAFFAADANLIDHAAATVPQWEGDTLVLRTPLADPRTASPAAPAAVLRGPAGGVGVVRAALQGGWPVAGAASAAAAAALPAPPPAPAPASWSASLLLAFLGGLLLNLMPCVFPVLSLKVMGFARHADERRRLVAGGLAYTAGVVLSFVALAALLLALRHGGEQLGWGFQLQSPPFIAALAVLFMLIGLNLADVFAFNAALPGNLAALRARHPVADDALTGVLAVAVASPCTAPFMGVALGAALSLPLAEALAVFAALGFGMAAPYLAASLWPPLANALPRPGPWMARFKTLMAFPMFATVVWLVWVLGHQVGIDGATALLALLVALALAAWLFGAAGLQPRARGVAGVLALVAVAALAVAGWPLLQAPAAQPAAGAPGTVWQPWSAPAVAEAQAAGRPVFVDFSAAWCVTCQFNERTTLADPALLADMASRRVLLLRADWTRQDPAITRELTALGRSGVPVYAFYPAAGGAPRLLSELPSRAEVRAALAKL